MGSRITRQLYKGQRNKAPKQSDLIQMGRLFTYFLSLFSAVKILHLIQLRIFYFQFAIGYIRDLDLLVAHLHTSKAQLLKDVSQVHSALTFEQALSSVWPFLIALWISIYNFKSSFIFGSLLNVLSQLILWFAYQHNQSWAHALAGIAQLIATLCHHTLLMCILKICNQFYKNTPYRPGLFAGLLASAHIGEHWSNHLVPIHNRIGGVYTITLLFSSIGAMSMVIIVAVYRIVADNVQVARASQINKGGWRIVPLALKTKFTAYVGQISIPLLLFIVLGGVSVGLVQLGLEPTYFYSHFLEYFTVCIWVVVLCSFYSLLPAYRIQVSASLMVVHLILVMLTDCGILLTEYHMQILKVVILSHLASVQTSFNWLISAGLFQSVCLVTKLLSPMVLPFYSVLLANASLILLKFAYRSNNNKMTALNQGYSQLEFQPVET